MARQTRFRGSPRDGRSARQTSWELGTGGTALTQLSASGASFLGSAIAPVVDGLTLVRTRGILQVQIESGTAVGDGAFGAFGIGRATSAAVAAGIGSVPTPITEQAWDGWLYHSFFAVHRGITGDSSVSNTQSYQIDSKAMRKLPVDESIFAVIEIVEIGGVILDVWHDSRMLFKLS